VWNSPGVAAALRKVLGEEHPDHEPYCYECGRPLPVEEDPS
jgi:hypothetical protein